MVTVTFYPQALKQLFGIDVCELNDEIVDLVNFAPKELMTRLSDAPNYLQRIDILTNFLLTRIHNVQQLDLLVEESISLINNPEIDTSISMLSKYLQTPS